MNLIITCQRNLEDPAMLEAQNMLERFGDKEALIEKTPFSGIILVKTSPVSYTHLTLPTN